ncbi:hypothetical protein [Almyronema epifaneia]|uniref:DNA-binding protein n=1 Tax=Almyronema epifaneia S1 TaxID=2991925 RepID=A0ABW6IJP3_9CYAN
MNQTEAADSVGLSERNARDFLRSKAIKSLLGQGYTPAKKDLIEVDSATQTRGQTRISPLSLSEVSAFWLWQAYRGNRQALSLCMGLIVESLERRFDNAFGVSRSEAEYNDRLAQRIQQLEIDLEQLGENYSEPDLLREHINRLEDQVKQLGGQPWQLPSSDEK